MPAKNTDQLPFDEGEPTNATPLDDEAEPTFELSPEDQAFAKELAQRPTEDAEAGED